MSHSATRRDFLTTSTGTLAGLGLLGVAERAAAAAAEPESKTASEQLAIGFIGTGIRFHTGLAAAATRHCLTVAISDVDAVQAGRAMQYVFDQHRDTNRPIKVDLHEDYRHLIDRDDIDAVVIGSPDHWHTKMAIDAMNAGKDVYCEKPLTLTIDEGKLIRKAIAKTGRIMQVGTQQRTEVEQRFPTAAAMIRDGRVGNVKEVTCAIGGSLACPSLAATDAPKHLNWDMWLGQAPMVDYRQGDVIHTSGYGAGHPLSRTHNYFRWWYEYSGGKLTDWGAHHVDCAMWALDKDRPGIGKVKIEPLSVEHPVSFDSDGMPTSDDRFNAATAFHVRVTFEDGIVMHVRDNAPDKGFDNGIMFEGDQGRMFVNRGKLTGKPVEELKENPLPNDALEKLYGQAQPKSHFHNFVECVKSRRTPISDAESHHRTLSICHAVNIAMRLNRVLTYDTATEMFVGDDQANGFVSREQRKGYEITV